MQNFKMFVIPCIIINNNNDFFCANILKDQAQWHHSFMERPVHLSFGRVKRIWTNRNMGGRVKNEGAKTIDIVSYALKVSINVFTCVFVVHFRSSGTF